MRKQAHEICLARGIDRDRLKHCLETGDNWGGMVYAFEFLTAAAAVLASWPEDDDPEPGIVFDPVVKDSLYREGAAVLMEEIEVSAQAKQAAMLAVMAAGDASNEKAWKGRVQNNIARFAALVRDDYGFWGKEAQGIIDAQVFTATYVSHELEESSTRLVLQLETKPSKRYPEGIEPIRTERTDTPPGWHMRPRVEALESGQEIVVWKKMEKGDDASYRVIVHMEPLRSKSSGGHTESKTPNRPSTPSRGDEGGADSPPTRSTGGLPSLPVEQSAEANAVALAMDSLTNRQKIAVRARCVGEHIEDWADPGPESIDKVLTIIKEVQA